MVISMNEPNITYVVGDALDPQTPGPKIIAHIVNNSGGWGRGFVVPLGKRWPASEAAYRAWSNMKRESEKLRLGDTQLVQVEEDIMVANMCAQDGYQRPERPIPVDYPSVTLCLTHVFRYCMRSGATVHMPRIGCGLGGGVWVEILACINQALADAAYKDDAPPKIPIFVYDLTEKDALGYALGADKVEKVPEEVGDDPLSLLAWRNMRRDLPA